MNHIAGPPGTSAPTSALPIIGTYAIAKYLLKYTNKYPDGPYDPTLDEWHQELKLILPPLCIFLMLLLISITIYAILSKRKARKEAQYDAEEDYRVHNYGVRKTTYWSRRWLPLGRVRMHLSRAKEIEAVELECPSVLCTPHNCVIAALPPAVVRDMV